MGKRRAKHPFEDNFFIDGFLGWMDSPEGQHSIEVYSTEQTGRPSRCKAAAENARKRHGKTLQSGS